MTPEKQKKWIEYGEKYFDKVSFIIECGGFDICHGSTTIDFKDSGEISNVKRIYNDRPQKSILPLDRSS